MRDSSRPRFGFYDVVKRLLDIVGSLFLLFFLLPFLFIIVFLIKIESEGSVLFYQRRCGRGGREFHMYKFRTMVKDAEALKSKLKNEIDGPMFKVKDDPRITRFGRYLRAWSVDELPQIINVLVGDMSFIGPRPLAEEEMEGDEEWKAARLSVKPGITGLWQVKGRESGRFDDWKHYDYEYVRDRSLFLDVKILIWTVLSVLHKKGSY